MRIRASTGRAMWSVHSPEIEKVNHLTCLPENGGVVGCGHYIGSANFFRLTTQGRTTFHYELEQDNPSYCEAVEHSLENDRIFLLFSSSSTHLTDDDTYNTYVFEFSNIGEFI